MMKGFLFDYGGTLDTGGCHWGKMFWHAYQSVVVPVSERQFREAYVYAERTLGRNPFILPDFTFRRTLETKLNLQLEYLNTLSPEGTAAVDASLLTDILYSAVLRHTAHAREVLRKLDSPKVLVSNFYGNMPTVLREFGLDGLFLHIVESAVVGVRQPDPRIFLLGVDALELQPEEVAVVGDSMDKDIIPAKRVGCQTIWLRGEPWTDDAVDVSAADRIIDNLSELVTT